MRHLIVMFFFSAAIFSFIVVYYTLTLNDAIISSSSLKVSKLVISDNSTPWKNQHHQSLLKDTIWLQNASVEQRFPPVIRLITQCEDLDLRGKWQVLQMKKFCQKYRRDNLLYSLPKLKSEKVLYRHLIYDVDARFIYCFLPKAGCTTLRRLVFASQGVIPPESASWEKVSESEYLRPAIRRQSFLNQNLTDYMRVYKLKTYFKFVVIRNPLERLVSAYRDKIEPPLEFTEHDMMSNPLVTSLAEVKNTIDLFQAHRRLILSKYSPEALKEWARANGSYNISVDFPSYIKWIESSWDYELNEHFSTQLRNIAPCRVGYNLFLNFKNYSRDVRLLIGKLNLNPDLFVDRNAHSSPEKETHSTLPHYYSQLSRELKRRLYSNRKRELDFYYHLYPEEIQSHSELLGIS